MDIQGIQAFLSVSETGSFSRAADALFLTQPAVSKRIQALEQSLGVALFDRIGKSVRLTEAGHALLPSCRRIIDEVAESQRIISNLRETTSGSLDLATSHHIGLHRLPPVLREFSRRFPGVELKLSFMDSEQACQQILSGGIELAIITLPGEPDSRLDLIPVWHDPLCVTVSKHHQLAATVPFVVTSVHVGYSVHRQSAGGGRDRQESTLDCLHRDIAFPRQCLLLVTVVTVDAGVGVVPDAIMAVWEDG